eukprot:1158439-Pelagomonas_calceolata.AAC.2
MSTASTYSTFLKVTQHQKQLLQWHEFHMNDESINGLELPSVMRMGPTKAASFHEHSNMFGNSLDIQLGAAIIVSLEAPMSYKNGSSNGWKLP